MKVCITSPIWAVPYAHPNLTSSLSFISTMVHCIFRNLEYDMFSFFISSYFKRNLCVQSYSQTYWYKLKKYVGTWGIPCIVLSFAAAGYFRGLSWKHFMGEVYGGHMACLLADCGLLMFLCISKDIMLSLYRYCMLVCVNMCIYIHIYESWFCVHYCRVSVVRYN